MKISFRIAFRNLVRQKRRNILLGSGIAFGIMVLFLSQSYTKGLSDILINSFIANIFGHIQINVSEKTDRSIPVIRDKKAVIDIINRTIDNVDYCRESVSTLTRAVGNGTGSLMLVVGVEKNNASFLNSLKIIDGDIKAFTGETKDTPIILYSPKAEELNLKAGDIVNIKLTTIYGQVQSARMTVAAIVKPQNIFMTMAGFTPLSTIKSLLGYRPYETSRLNIVLNHVNKPEETVVKANLLQKAFKAEPVFVNLTLMNDNVKAEAIAAGLHTKPDIKDIFISEFNLSSDIYGNFLNEDTTVIIGRGIANKLGSKLNDRITLSLDTKYEGRGLPDTKFTIVGIIDNNLYDRGSKQSMKVSPPRSNNLVDFHIKTDVYKDIVFFNAPGFCKLYSEYLPADNSNEKLIKEVKKRKTIMNAIVYDKTLLNRPGNSKEWKELLRGIRNYRKPGSLMHITSMKETAEDVLKIESALNLICLITVIILFTIILTGSVNALRMTIRERTREIGTIRSIGMQQKHVVRIFVIESALLSLFASMAGIGLAFIIMLLLSKIPFKVDNLFSMLIDNGHLHFLPEFKIILVDIIITLVVTVLTTWFPAKKAAAMSVTKALRHYE